MTKLAIGTAQFGLDYGISNSTGKVNFVEAKEILDFASKINIDTIDTAISYGNSEEILGKIGVKDFKVITKLPKVPANIINHDIWIKENLTNSIDKLKVNKIYAVLLHSSNDFLGEKGYDLFQALSKLKEDGFISNIGVSIYNPEELDNIENNSIPLDIVQTPFNIIDRRIELSGWLDKLAKNKIKVHVRSVFLQGLLLQNSNNRNPYFMKWNNYFNKLDEWINDTKQTKLGAAINFSYSFNQINNIIVGVQNKFQLSEISKSILQEFSHPIPSELHIDDLMLVNPSNWKL